MLHRTIGVITVLGDSELPATIKAFGAERWRLNGTTYHQARVTTQSGESLRVIIGCCPGSGNVEAVLPTANLIRQINPACMLLIGIACGPRSLQLGDVVLSTSIIAYDYIKSFPSHAENRSRILGQFSTPLSDSANRLEDVHLEAWRARYRELGNPGRDPVIHRGKTILSGSRVIADGMLGAKHVESGSICAGDMDSYGFATACEAHGVPWIVIRGISDHGDQEKDSPTSKDAMHKPASLAAATLAHTFLTHAFQLPDVPPTTPLRNYMIQKIEEQSSNAVQELRRRVLGRGGPVEFSRAIMDELRRGATRFVALCGPKPWGYRSAVDYYSQCFDWARGSGQNLVHTPLVRYFVRPRTDFSTWDKCVIAAHRPSEGAEARVVGIDDFFQATEVATDILDDGLGIVAVEICTSSQFNSSWKVFLHAGREQSFRFAEIHEGYARAEILRLLDSLSPLATDWCDAGESVTSSWPPSKEVYDASHARM